MMQFDVTNYAAPFISPRSPPQEGSGEVTVDSVHIRSPATVPGRLERLADHLWKEVRLR